MNKTEQDYEPLFQALREIYQDGLPFNRLLGMQVTKLDLNTAEIRVDMRDELVGNFIRGILHGGVISTVLDAVGGLTASVGLLQQLVEQEAQEALRRFGKMGTIDLRVDYLRPGFGKYFIARGAILRAGNKVSVTRMELHNDEDVLIAVGTGTYLVG
jgi:uncharacterized protein (TIGR00369 family)